MVCTLVFAGPRFGRSRQYKYIAELDNYLASAARLVHCHFKLQLSVELWDNLLLPLSCLGLIEVRNESRAGLLQLYAHADLVAGLLWVQQIVVG